MSEPQLRQRQQDKPAAVGAWRSLLVQAEPEGGPQLSAAIALARQLGASVMGVGVGGVDPVVFSLWREGMEAYGVLHEQLKDDLSKAAEAFRAASGAVPSEWMSLEERPALAMARLSRGADAIVARRDGGEEPYRTPDPAELALLSGRPILVAPRSGEALEGQRVVVAWKDTREARRAVADAMPLLGRAQEVMVLELRPADEIDASSAGAVAGFLSRHGVTAFERVVGAEDFRTSEMIRAEARAFGADLVVMGCYGHSRLGEWVFGGVTREMLASDEGFLLLSH